MLTSGFFVTVSISRISATCNRGGTSTARQHGLPIVVGVEAHEQAVVANVVGGHDGIQSGGVSSSGVDGHWRRPRNLDRHGRPHRGRGYITNVTKAQSNVTKSRCWATQSREEFTCAGLTGSVDALELRNTEIGRQSGQHSL
jgi:hypothetical protein